MTSKQYKIKRSQPHLLFISFGPNMYYKLVRNDSTKSSSPQTWNLSLPATVGRGPESSVCIDDESISRLHCKLFLASDESLHIRDNGSTNGTYVNGDRIQHPVSLTPGDVLQLGSVLLQIQFASDTDPGPAAPKKTTPSVAATQPMRTIPSQSFTMHEVPEKRWWEFWKS